MEFLWGLPANAAVQGLLYAVAFLILHMLLTARDVGSFALWLADQFAPKQPDRWDGRLATALAETRKANWLMFSRCASFFTAGGMSYWIHTFYVHSHPTLAEGSVFAAVSCTYVLFLATATRAVDLTAERVRACCSFFYCSMMVCFLAVPFARGLHLDINVMVVQLTSCRFILSAVATDTKLSAPWQVLLTAGQLWADFMAPGGLNHPGFCVFLQLVALGLTIVLSWVLETGVRATLCAQFLHSDAESLMSSFRRMLRGVCDGEVLLDSNLRVHSVSDCLKHLLMTSANLHGKPFTQVFDPADLKRFKDFVTEGSPEDPPSKGSVPSSLRVSLVGAASTRVCVELYHVSISKLYGSHDPYHLIAWKEDAESREQPMQARQEVACPSTTLRQLTRPAAAHEASPPCGALTELFSQMADVSLLVDTATMHYSTRQVNLRFPCRFYSPQTHPPHLRSMVLPTEWPTIQHELARYAQDQQETYAIQPRPLPALRCRTGQASSRYRVAQKVEISAHRSTKVWIRLGNFSERSTSQERRVDSQRTARKPRCE
ncbi:unnamed protein product [Symbiodinium sp. CCMP2592]|nr:unnamed protein product [Symbiodinium sp. CCMP2592]